MTALSRVVLYDFIEKGRNRGIKHDGGRCIQKKTIRRHWGREAPVSTVQCHLNLKFTLYIAKQKLVHSNGVMCLKMGALLLPYSRQSTLLYVDVGVQVQSKAKRRSLDNPALDSRFPWAIGDQVSSSDSFILAWAAAVS